MFEDLLSGTPQEWYQKGVDFNIKKEFIMAYKSS